MSSFTDYDVVSSTSEQKKRKRLHSVKMSGYHSC